MDNKEGISNLSKIEATKQSFDDFLDIAIRELPILRGNEKEKFLQDISKFIDKCENGVFDFEGMVMSGRKKHYILSIRKILKLLQYSFGDKSGYVVDLRSVKPKQGGGVIDTFKSLVFGSEIETLKYSEEDFKKIKLIQDGVPKNNISELEKIEDVLLFFRCQLTSLEEIESE